MSRSLATAGFLLLLVPSISGRADSPPIWIRVESAPDAPVAIEREPLARELERDLDRPLTEVPHGGDTLTIRIDEQGLAEVVYRQGSETRARSVPLPADRQEAARVLVLIASNLSREAPTFVHPSPPSASSPPVSILQAPIAEAVPEAAIASDAPSDIPIDGDPETRRWHIALLTRVGVAFGTLQLNEFEDVPEHVVSVDETWGWNQMGLEFMGSLTPNLALGVTDLTVIRSSNMTRPGSLGFSLTPVLEAGGFVHRRIQLYGRAGLDIQLRETDSNAIGTLQSAVRLGAGVRFYPSRVFSIGLEVQGAYALSDGHIAGNAIGTESTAGTYLLSGTLAFGFHF